MVDEREGLPMLPRVVDLFCGAGGLAVGFQAAGCQIDAAVDLDVVAGDTFRENLAILQPAAPPRVLTGLNSDLEHLDLALVVNRPPDILVGGPPCQGFSRLGRGKLDSLSDEGFEGDPRNQLYRRFLDAVRRWRPPALVMENVPGMVSVRGINYAAIVVGELAAAGYRVGYAQLNAVWFGVPQFRERLFFLGLREDLGMRPQAPLATNRVLLPDGYRRPLSRRVEKLPFEPDWERLEGELPVLFARGAGAAVTVSEALDDLPVLIDHLDGTALSRGDLHRLRAYRSDPHTAYARLMRTWPGLPPSDLVKDHVVRRTPRDYKTFRRMRHGDRYPQALRIARENFVEEVERRRLLGTAPTQDTPEWETLERKFVPPYPEGSFDDRWRKLIPDQPSWTVPAHLAKDSYSHIHHDSDQARMISVREAARLQSFADGFCFSGNMGDCFRQIGNAVPPLLAWAIAHSLLRTLGYEATPPPNLSGESQG
jgi:DNA (cytosine-5)-methyltransferase 1